MINKKISICVFVHHSVADSQPYYAELYINQLTNHFDKIKLLANNPKLNPGNFENFTDVEFI